MPSRSVAPLGYWETVVSWPAGVVGASFSVTLGVALGIYLTVCAARLAAIQALLAE